VAPDYPALEERHSGLVRPLVLRVSLALAIPPPLPLESSGASTAGIRAVAVAAAGVNPTDIGLRAMGADGIDPPWTPGMDAAGTVESIGTGVERVNVGDRVMAAVSPRRPDGGAQAALLVVPEASAVPIPDGATLEQAATLPMNGLTALLGLDLLGLAPGQTLVVSGGAGVLGSYVIPLASERGLRVIADARPEDEELVRSFGADVIVPRGEQFNDAVREAAPAGADALFDTALLGRSGFAALADGGAGGKFVYDRLRCAQV